MALTLFEVTAHSTPCLCCASARVRVAHQHPIVAGMKLCAGCGFPRPDAAQGEAPIPRGYMRLIRIGRYWAIFVGLFTLAPVRLRILWLRAQWAVQRTRRLFIERRHVRALKKIAVLERQLNAARTPNPYPNEPPTLH